jgi:translocation and assembly module TamB
MSASARVSGPLLPDSPLKAEAKGRLPNIGLLRPLIQRVVDPGELTGDLKINIDAEGTLGDPVFNGGAYLADGSLGLPAAGVVLNDINIAAESQGADTLRVTGELRSGNGSAEISGEIHATEKPGLEADIRIQGKNLASVRVPDLSVDTSPDLKLHIGEDVFDISGTLLIPTATAQIRTLPKSAVPRSTDVIMHTPEGSVEQQQGTIVTGNVEVVLGDDVRFSGFGLTSRLEGGLRLTQSRGGFLRSGGTVRVRDGFLTGYGKELRVDRGVLTFTGPLDDPLLNIQVSRESIYEGRQYTIGLRLTGTAQNVKTEPFSRPTMSERDVLSFLLLDRPSTSDSDAGGAALALGLQQLLPDQSGRFGLDEVSFETNDANEAAMVAGKRINDKLYVRYVFGSLGQPGAFRIRYTLGRGFSLEASTGARQSMDLIYMLER